MKSVRIAHHARCNNGWWKTSTIRPVRDGKSAGCGTGVGSGRTMKTSACGNGSGSCVAGSHVDYYAYGNGVYPMIGWTGSFWYAGA
jgi:hypothetical protein